MIKKRPTTSREVAAFTLFSMEEDKAWSDGALHQYLERAGLQARDAALATQLVYGVLQNYAMCDFYLSRYSKVRLKKIAPRVLWCLRMAIYQLTMLQRVPAHAAVSETVTLIERYAHASPRTIGFANGVLRTVARATEEGTLPAPNCPDKESYYALKYSHQEWLVRLLSAQYGQQEAGKICAANNAATPLTLRVNQLRTTTEQTFAILQDAGFSPRMHPVLPNLILCEGGNIAALPLFQQGDVTVQDGAGIICVDVMDPKPSTLAMDCCAAPGGKSFYIAERMKNTGKILSCDIYDHKLDKIKDGAQRLGLTCITVQKADATQTRPELCGQADAVLCDVPCSGFGILRKKPEIREKKEIDTLPILQQQILEACAPYVRVGGVLIYSTCTILQRENEDVVQAFLKRNPAYKLEAFSHPACGECATGMVTLLPHIHDTDGFFIAKLRRTI